MKQDIYQAYNAALISLEKYNASKIKITHKGNIIILDVPAINAKNLASDLEKTNFNPFV